MRRPASTRGEGVKRPAEEGEVNLRAEALQRWETGYSVKLGYLDVKEFQNCKGLVVLEASYYHRPVTLAGKIASITLRGESVMLRMALTGMGDEELLKYHT